MSKGAPERLKRRKVSEAARAVAKAAPRQSGVLVVVNDPDLQWRLARMLTVQGNRVVGTSSGDGAIALIKEWAMDLVLVDDALPGMDALEVVRRIRVAHPEMPVVLMHGESVKIESAHSAGARVATLAKPFRLETLVDLLASLTSAPAE